MTEGIAAAIPKSSSLILLKKEKKLNVRYRDAGTPRRGRDNAVDNGPLKEATARRLT